MFCVIALYLLESINFMASFAVTFAVAELGIFQGIAQNVKLICRDEMLHGRGGGKILSILKRLWPETWAEIQPLAAKMLHSVVEDEKQWSSHLFSEGRQLVGLNKPLLDRYVEHVAYPVAVELEVPWEETALPIPYMLTYIDSSKVQTAAQEMQLTSYLVNSLVSVPHEEMETLLKEFR
jgi:ribonucleoside-diphosphate reductase beta chain